MVVTRRPLVEKMALFWHHVFATGVSKVEHSPSMVKHVQMFREKGLGDFHTLLVELSKDPAMIFWLDNNENRMGQPNENYGRELLEPLLDGCRQLQRRRHQERLPRVHRWTFTQPIPIYPQGHYPSEFEFRPELHDDDPKTFLGETGKLRRRGHHRHYRQAGGDRAVHREAHLQLFVADEPQVPAWSVEPPQDQEAVDTLVKAYFATDGDLRAIMRTLFLSDFFKEARFKRIKSPTELVAGVLKLGGSLTYPKPGMTSYQASATLMGQQLLNPPTVEGWHTGKEWIDGGTLNEADQLRRRALRDEDNQRAEHRGPTRRLRRIVVSGRVHQPVPRSARTPGCRVPDPGDAARVRCRIGRNAGPQHPGGA